MTIAVTEVRGDEIEALIPLLLLAEVSERALRWGLGHLDDAVYRLTEDGQTIGAATMQWRNDPAEIMELAIASALQGRGYGKQLVGWLVEEARRRGKQQLLVGTANSSISNIAFYQKCGFRMDHVRPDYFWYYDPPHYEHGLRTRDMLVFRYDLAQKNS
jgi:GNAT superfamily N-acetyltransferase